jgi:hypothetical protein
VPPDFLRRLHGRISRMVALATHQTAGRLPKHLRVSPGQKCTRLGLVEGKALWPRLLQISEHAARLGLVYQLDLGQDLFKAQAFRLLAFQRLRRHLYYFHLLS